MHEILNLINVFKIYNIGKVRSILNCNLETESILKDKKWKTKIKIENVIAKINKILSK